MSFLTKMWNWGSGRDQFNFQGWPVLYRGTQTMRQIIYQQCTVRLDKIKGDVFLIFEDTNPDKTKQSGEYFASPHLHMKILAYSTNHGHARYHCVEWNVEKEQQTYDGLRLGCAFTSLVDAECFLKNLQTIEEELVQSASQRSQNSEESSEAPKLMEIEYDQNPNHEAEINQILIQQSKNPAVRLANTCKLFAVNPDKNEVILQNAVFVIAVTGEARYSFYVIGPNNKVCIEQPMNVEMSYDIIAYSAQLKWYDERVNPPAIYKAIFRNRQIIMSINFEISRCLKELKAQRRRDSVMGSRRSIKSHVMIEERVVNKQKSKSKSVNKSNVEKIVNKSKVGTSKSPQPRRSKRISKKDLESEHEDESSEEQVEEEVIPHVRRSQRILKAMESEEEQQQSQSDVEKDVATKKKSMPKSKVESSSEANKKHLFQGKCVERTFVFNDKNIEIVKIMRDQKINIISNNKIYSSSKTQLTPKKMVFNDAQSKAMIQTYEDTMVYMDLNKFKPISQFGHRKNNAIVDFCPQFKHADLGSFKNYLAVTDSTVGYFDPRVGNGKLQLIKQYAEDKKFTSVAVRKDSCFAIGSQSGKIRLFDPQYTLASCSNINVENRKEQVLHLESTKDGKWLLATYSDHILLFQTYTDVDNIHTDMYRRGTSHKARPEEPIELKLKAQHQKLIANGMILANAKFDESKKSYQKFIVSGIGQYVFTWSFSELMKKKNSKYEATKVGDTVLDVDFIFEDNSRILTATSHDLHIAKNPFAK